MEHYKAYKKYKKKYKQLLVSRSSEVRMRGGAEENPIPEAVVDATQRMEVGATEVDPVPEFHPPPPLVEYQLAPDRSLIPHLNRLLRKISGLNWFIKRRPFKNTQDLDIKIKNYTEILNEFITNVMGTLPEMSVNNFNTDVGNKLIISVFDNDRELASYFSYQYDKWEAVGSSFSVDRQGLTDEIDWNIGKASEIYRTNLIKSIKLLKKHIEKEHPFSPWPDARSSK
jgi:hypothetical protein